ncbi:MAG: effector-associated domain EAD1-containing protein [Microcystis sp. 49638_E5]|jgi:hypothetical protein|uniref:effector-associated domain EAD1-containing protein n=1 Tax=Microcystis sp. 49638_E5 TaxID=2904986 RepID=UPI002590E7A1|nr:effector-associated domain EAD1-containing protein [Microcystis sp. 49638_E5]MCE2671878.1 effector-associated domain EAD1-containing protein [Microcystis sp. 49638_E5]
MSLIPRNNKENIQSDNAAIKVYEFAQEIAPLVARTEFIDTLLDYRRRTQNVITKLRLTSEQVEKNAPKELADIVYLLTFSPQNKEAERVECVELTILGLKALKEQLKGGFGFASYDLTIAELEQLAQYELTRLEDDIVTAPAVGLVTNITNNITAVNSDVTVSYSGKKLTGQEIGELRRVILAAFPSQDEFAITLSEKLDINWTSVKNGSNYDTAVFNFITQYTESYGMTASFVKALASKRPRNSALIEWANRF